MKRVWLSVCLIVAMLPLVTQAKRMPYTNEIVDADSLVAIWTAAEVKDMKLAAPKTVINGDPAAAVELKRGQTTSVVMRLKKGEELILCINRYRSGKHTAHVSQVWAATDENVKMLKGLVRVQKDVEKWDSYSIEDQVKRAEIIVRGHVYDPSKISITRHAVKVKQVLKSDKLKAHGTDFDLRVYPSTPRTEIEKDSLVLIQQLPGTGPGSRIMKLIPWDKADDYLEYLKEEK